MSKCCPYCGADWILGNVTTTIKYNHYRCGSNYPGQRSERCKDRQIANLQKRITELERRKELCVAFAKAVKSWFTLGGDHPLLPVVEAFVESQEE